MFQPETEDMLPRIAPKPTTGPGLNEPAVMPTVPEVSILFTQQEPVSAAISGNNELQQSKPQQSYASWKKSVLPKVVYPAVKENIAPSDPQNIVAQSSQNYVELPSNVFPLRAAPPKNFHYSTDSYRRSLESGMPSHNSSPDVHVFDGTKPSLAQIHQQQPKRRSFDALPQQHATRSPPPLARPRSEHIDVLTICAGTQTESYSIKSNLIEENQQLLNILATKSDLKNLIELIQEMREEQTRLTQICTVLLEQQYQVATTAKLKTVLKDVSTQCDTYGTDVIRESNTPKRSEDNNNRNQPYAVEAQNVLHHGLIANQDVLSPRPAAHSTKYRQNTPQIAYKQGMHQQLTQKNNKVLSIPATEQSLVMNELALKYLPNDKLTELMQELQMSSPAKSKPAETDQNFDQNCNQAKFAVTPLRNIDNFDKGPNDLSNASYKYLKKYRLLPEVPHIEHITSTTPKSTRPQKHHYQRDQSPLSGLQGVPQENMLDLDAIRRQPKFL